MTRRWFLSRLTAAAAAGTAAGCSRREAGGTAGPSPSMEELKQAAAGPVVDFSAVDSPVVIDSIQVLKRGREYFVHVRSKDGAEGISVANFHAPYLYPILLQRVAPFFIGKDVRRLEELEWELYRWRSNYKLQGLAFWCPHAWVEFAILDMFGRILNKSIAELIGGVRRKEIPFYVASGRRDSTPEEEVDYLQKLVEETGARAVKFRVGGRMSRNADALPGRTEKLIPLARKTLGEGIDIHADSNSSYDPPEAIRVGRLLEEIDAVYFEEPCPFDHLEETKAVADALAIPVAGGEQEYSEWRFRWQIHRRCVDIVQPDLHYYGGMIRSMRVARMAELAGMPTTVHISGGFGFVYMLHFAAAVKDPGRYQEYKRGVERYGSWFDPPLRSKDGALTVPQGPGVGIRDIGAVLRGAAALA